MATPKKLVCVLMFVTFKADAARMRAFGLNGTHSPETGRACWNVTTDSKRESVLRALPAGTLGRLEWWYSDGTFTSSGLGPTGPVAWDRE